MRDDLVYDVGMHRGEDTAFYLKKGYRVLGIEADPDLAAQCRRRFAHEITGGRLTIVEGAIVEPDALAAGTIRFFKNPSVSVWGTIDPAWSQRNDKMGASSQEIVVRCLDLGATMAEYGVPYALKIDIEGADRIALAALQRVGKRPKFVSLEDEKVDFERLKGDLDLLCSLGYTKFRAMQQDGIGGRVFEGKDRRGGAIKHEFEYGASGPFGPDLEGPWMTRAEILVEYKWIFEMYRVFGDTSPCASSPELERARSELEKAVGRSLPGWYDTHATF